MEVLARGFTREVAVALHRGDERGDDDGARIGEECGDFADAANVLRAIAGRKAQIAVQPQAHVVAVEYVDGRAACKERALQRHRERRFSGAREPRQPDHGAAVTVAVLPARKP